MPVLSYVHQLFNTEQCQAYIHTLRWKDRPLQCPRCQSQDIDPWGQYHYRPGCKRYWCNGCQRTFNDLTHTLLHQSRRSLAYWILATFLLCLSCSSRRIARELGVHGRTSYRWCWWLRNAAVSYEMGRQLAGTVEADDLYHIAGNKGQAKQGGSKPLGRRPRCRRKKCEARPGALRQRPARDHRLGEPARDCCGPCGQGFHRQDGTESRRHRSPSGQSALYRLGEQLSGGEGLHARIRESHPERVRTRGRARESRGVPVLFTQAIPAGVSWPQQVQPAGVCRILSVPAELSSAECLRTGRADLAGSARPRHCQQSQEG
jgi:transposase-like protein